MQEFSNNRYLYEMEPELVKEWHPTANGKLTPRSADIACSEAVWWICSQSHEWKDTIINRIKGTGCPYCGSYPADKDFPGNKSISIGSKYSETYNLPFKKPEIPYESAFPETYSGNNARKNRRYKSNGTVIIEMPSSGHLFYAKMKNFSAEGMCFETEAAIKPMTAIKIKLKKPLFVSKQTIYSSTVRWCKAFDDDSRFFSSYGIGVKLNYPKP